MTARRAGPGRQPADQDQAGSGAVMTVEEATAAYPDEWIFMEITRDGRTDREIAGVVVAHSPRRSDLTAIEIETIKRRPAGVVGFSTFYGVPLFDSHEEWLAYHAERAGSHEREA
jgi:hypothetical protein